MIGWGFIAAVGVGLLYAVLRQRVIQTPDVLGTYVSERCLTGILTQYNKTYNTSEGI